MVEYIIIENAVVEALRNEGEYALTALEHYINTGEYEHDIWDGLLPYMYTNDIFGLYEAKEPKKPGKLKQFIKKGIEKFKKYNPISLSRKAIGGAIYRAGRKRFKERISSIKERARDKAANYQFGVKKSRHNAREKIKTAAEFLKRAKQDGDQKFIDSKREHLKRLGSVFRDDIKHSKKRERNEYTSTVDRNISGYKKSPLYQKDRKLMNLGRKIAGRPVRK